MAPRAAPWLPQTVVCVNLNRNLTGQSGTYCKLTEPIWPFSGLKPPLGYHSKVWHKIKKDREKLSASLLLVTSDAF